MLLSAGIANLQSKKQKALLHKNGGWIELHVLKYVKKTQEVSWTTLAKYLQVSVQLLLTQKPKPFSESSETLKHRLEAANAKKHKFIAKTHAYEKEYQDRGNWRQRINRNKSGE